MYDPDIAEERVIDEVALLDRQLDDSLAGFDELLLKEMDKIRSNSAKKMLDLAEEAAEAAKRLHERGLGAETYGSDLSESGEQASAEEGSGTEGKKGDDETGTEHRAEDKGAGTHTTSRESSRKGSEGSPRDDESRSDYEDDDIVARQLREAAEAETDPELKERLWKEYEEYKKNRL
jgi:hypothetical protein